MYIVPISGMITPIEAVSNAFEPKTEESSAVGSPTFADVFKNIIGDAVDTNAQKQEDILQLALGNTDNLEEIQANLTKAEIATELLVTVKNSVVDAYNEIIKMSV